MRNFVAIVVAIGLVVFALSMATSLQWYRRNHARRRRDIEHRGQTIVTEIPSSDGLQFFTEDAEAFYWSDHRIPKTEIRSTRILISGAPITARVARRFSTQAAEDIIDLDTKPEAFARDRWDVAIDLGGTFVLVECGAIRERVSQELARQVFEAVKADIDTRDTERESLTHEST